VGRSRLFDSRTHAVRKGVADIALAGSIFAPHYARPEMRSISVASCPLHTAPQQEAPAGSQLLLGEDFYVLDIAGGWAWGYCGHDHYVGYVPEEALGAAKEATHFISASAAPLFSAADIKSSVNMTLSLGARLTGAIEGDFLITEQGYVHRRHVAPMGTAFSDPVATAERLIGAPYLWGGRGAGGVDCSGLVQIALELSGIQCPRDSDQQRAELGAQIESGEPLRRGDLVFFSGHVGFMADESQLLHANAWWMAVVAEPLNDVVDRLRPVHNQPILSIHRLAA